MKIRKKIGNLGKDKLQQIVEAFISDLEQGAVAVLEYLEDVENPEFLELELDDEEKIISFTRKDGSHYIYNLSSETIDALKDRISELESNTGITTFETIDDPENRLQIGKDRDDKVYNYRKPDGTLVENVGIESPKITTDSLIAKEVDIEGGHATLDSLELTKQGMSDFQQALKDAGFHSGVGDWSESSSLEIPEPRLIFINFTKDSGDVTWPISKTQDEECWMEFYDKAGNYFKKRVIFNAQGNSSMAFAKKNGSIDICNDEWEGEDTFKLKIGSWAPQDSFHFKALATDFFKGLSFISYKIALQVQNTRPYDENRTWKLGLLNGRTIGTDQFTSEQVDDLSVNLDNGALCQPDGIPAIIHLNGEFYGIYVFALKKHRDNYHMDKNNPTHIHVDCGDGGNMFNLNWNGFEVRAPKALVYAQAHNGTYKYDSDDPGQFEIAGPTDGTTNTDSWTSGTAYPVNKVVKHNKHYYINTIEDNEAEPIYDKKDNGDDKPDYKNKTGCGWINCTNSVKVKASIISIKLRLAEIKALLIISTSNGNIQLGEFVGAWNENDNFGKGAWVISEDHYYMSIHSTNAGNPVSDTNNWQDITQDISTLREAYESYFDVQNIVDYELVQCAVSDPDSITKNCQWTSWDGIRWYINNYDKDMSFGGDFVGWITEPVRTVGGWARDVRTEGSSNSLSLNYPIGIAIKLYKDRFQTRWQELVSKGIFTTENFMSLINDWTKRIGEKYYSKEYTEKWPESSCFRDNGVEHEYWEFTGHEYYSTSVPLYDENTNYQVGDEVAIDYRQGTYGYAILTCKKACQGVNPIKTTHPSQPKWFGYYDSVWRVQKFIEENFRLENEFFNSLIS